MIVFGGDGKAVEHNLRRPIRDVVAVAVRKEEQPRRAQQPNAAETQLDAGEHLHAVGEDGSPVELAVAIGVFKDQDAVALGEVEPLGPLGVRVVLGDPEPAARVPGHRDRVSNVGLGGEDRDVEAVRDAKLAAATPAGMGASVAVSPFRGSGRRSSPASARAGARPARRFPTRAAILGA